MIMFNCSLSTTCVSPISRAASFNAPNVSLNSPLTFGCKYHDCDGGDNENNHYNDDMIIIMMEIMMRFHHQEIWSSPIFLPICSSRAKWNWDSTGMLHHCVSCIVLMMIILLVIQKKFGILIYSSKSCSLPARMMRSAQLRPSPNSSWKYMKLQFPFLLALFSVFFRW